ncbi:hypothetical protein [Desulfomonile tiedjei]|uniref:Uncharacterized protein n=1 Tax=Desulfomonile tiedjei (strain ATCC 49306 / DSM 6799 / DCB-1) TaxID=706587 RepID=I4C6L9_DESTA|nr:hypothetical protein [Desulfomonile tiedjei]AFM25210.1 hypothetical protein Desti_2530 [Desulfomonile tiedjei DSM 6799]
MKSLSVGLAIFLLVVFAGGYFTVKGEPLFSRIDSALHTDVLMDLHHGIFFFVYRGKDKIRATEEGLSTFQEAPLGFDKKKQYRRIEDASKY